MASNKKREEDPLAYQQEGQDDAVVGLYLSRSRVEMIEADDGGDEDFWEEAPNFKQTQDHIYNCN